MNKFINFKKILFSLFLLSLSFSPVFLMEDETAGYEPMEQVEMDQPESIAIEKEWEQMAQDDAQAQELKIDQIIFQALCAHHPFTHISPDSENWFNFYCFFKYKINSCIESLDFTKINFLINDQVLFYIVKYFKNIKKLNFALCDKISDIGLKFLANEYCNIKVLNLTCCNKITDAGLLFFAHCYRLESLDLTFCNKITIAGLTAFANCKNLYSLTLSGCSEITVDDVFQIIINFPKLQFLFLSKCPKITAEGIQRLREIHPNLNIIR